MKEKKKRKILWQTNVGSHMWGMEHDGSDYDIFECFMVSPIDILRGKADVRSESVTEANVDYAVHEIGTIVNQRSEEHTSELQSH